MNFKIGQVVELKSGGMQMTVTNTLEDGEVLCCWQDKNGELRYSGFSPLCLVLVEE